MELQSNKNLFDIRSLLFLGTVFALLFFAVLSGNGYRSFDWILIVTDEDRWLEALQALGYLAGFLICLLGMFVSRKKPFFVIWAILTLFFVGEETSWGQRIFNYEVESVQKHSLQNEFNIHNLSIFNFGGVTSAKDWKQALKALLDMQFVFQVCFFLYFAFIPIVINFSDGLKSVVSKLLYIPPAWQLVFLFLISFVATYVSVLLVGDELYKDAIVEIRETIFGIVVPIYLYQTLDSHHNQTM